MDPAGIVPILVTPFDRDGRIDVPSLHRLVDDYGGNGAAAVVVPAVASEVDKLTPAEQLLLVRETLAAAGDRAGAVRAFEQVLPHLAWSRQHIDINLHLLKRYCRRRGLFHTYALRPPALDFDDCHAQ
jgi:dihydrodipicolinate synthase/N-acetylneuraminate lyase